MHQHPALVEALARDRAVELRREAELSALRRSDPDRRRIVDSVRSVTGWFLVQVGLRLAAPRHVTRSA